MIENIKIFNETHRRLVRFVISGGSAAVTEYLIFLVLHVAGLHILVANSLSFLGGLAVSFSLNKLWVFKVRGSGTNQFGKYFILALINLCISDGLIWLAVNNLSIKPLIAKLAVMVTIATWNYFIFSRLIFVDNDDV